MKERRVKVEERWREKNIRQEQVSKKERIETGRRKSRNKEKKIAMAYFRTTAETARNNSKD